MTMESYSDYDLDILFNEQVLQDLDADRPSSTRRALAAMNQGSKEVGDPGGSLCQGLTAVHNFEVPDRLKYLCNTISLSHGLR